MDGYSTYDHMLYNAANEKTPGDGNNVQILDLNTAFKSLFEKQECNVMKYVIFVQLSFIFCVL